METHTTASPSMGSTAQVTVLHPDARALDRIAQLGIRRLRDLERAWSRFDPDSGLSHLNAQAGQGPIVVSQDVLLLVEAMTSAWRLTQGRCNAAAGEAMHAAGYATTTVAGTIPAIVRDPAPFPSLDGVVLNMPASQVTLPAGLSLDPGSIGKGLAAGWVCADLLNAGARGVAVDVGGDIVLGGEAPGGTWVIDVANELSPESATPAASIEWQPKPGMLLAVTTSSTTRRAWSGGHHLLDPDTGKALPAAGSTEPFVAATTICAGAGRDVGARAEALTTAVMVTGSRTRPGDAAPMLARASAAALVQMANTSVRVLGAVPEGVTTRPVEQHP